MIEYGPEILAERSKHRITQETLAKRAGIHTATLVDIEQKRIGIDDETYETLKNAIADEIASEDAA